MNELQNAASRLGDSAKSLDDAQEERAAAAAAGVRSGRRVTQRPSCRPSPLACPVHTPQAEPMNLLSSSRGEDVLPRYPVKDFIDATHSCLRLPDCVLTSPSRGICRARLKTHAARPFVAPEDGRRVSEEPVFSRGSERHPLKPFPGLLLSAL